MKLLIDIPEHVYEHAKEESEDSRDEGEAMRAIANGSPARCKGMDEAEKERLIKKDIKSIENRVRSAFNQGYDMGVKEMKAYKEQGGEVAMAMCDKYCKYPESYEGTFDEMLEEVCAECPMCRVL